MSSKSKSDLYLQILCQSECGRKWILDLPPKLRPHQSELEIMLGKVFSGRLDSTHNLNLARQLSLNWCLSKARAHGLSFDDCFLES